MTFGPTGGTWPADTSLMPYAGDPDLADVRHQLDRLVRARTAWGLSSSEQRRYQSLCALEAALLASR